MSYAFICWFSVQFKAWMHGYRAWIRSNICCGDMYVCIENSHGEEHVYGWKQTQTGRGFCRLQKWKTVSMGDRSYIQRGVICIEIYRSWATLCITDQSFDWNTTYTVVTESVLVKCTCYFLPLYCPENAHSVVKCRLVYLFHTRLHCQFFWCYNARACKMLNM